VKAFYRIGARTRDGRIVTGGGGMSGASSADAIIARTGAAIDSPVDKHGSEQGEPHYGRTLASQ
jgi:hypothetical protein